jgi:hypothetical protein
LWKSAVRNWWSTWTWSRLKVSDLMLHSSKRRPLNPYWEYTFSFLKFLLSEGQEQFNFEPRLKGSGQRLYYISYYEIINYILYCICIYLYIYRA